MLPQDFLQRMEQMLGAEYPAFLKSYDKDRHQALRLNILKGSVGKLRERLPFSLSPVPWAEDGFYYGKDDAPGKHPFHEAGVYYIQEPSAMAPASFLMGELEEEDSGCGAPGGERVLDLCAAPGGKSTQLAAAMRKAAGEGDAGILVCNEIHPARAKILSENIERMGIGNALVTNETPQRLAEVFDAYFTRILVDAPCSGEGMFRKNEEACGEWSTENVTLCAKRQAEILDCAASMLSPGGRLVYSTCTFAPEENEGSIAGFLTRHPEFRIVRVKKTEGMADGNPEWAYFGQETKGDLRPELKHTVRLWPHKLKGEGHYAAVLIKEGELQPGFCVSGEEKGISKKERNVPGKGILEFLQFAEETLLPETVRRLSEGVYLKFGGQLYLAPQGMPSVKGLKVLRPGLHLGTVKKDRFEPSHALALALQPEQVLHTVNLSSESAEIRSYLNGGTFPCEGEKGWYLITVDGFGIGWGKLAGGIMKNHYPKGLRKPL